MKKIVLIVLLLVLVAAGAFVYVNSTSKYEASKYSMNVSPEEKGFAVGSTIEFELPDQFGKSYTLGNDVQKLIFAFSKDTGHIIKTHMLDQKDGYLESKNAVIVADISGMPVVIRNAFALPDLRKSNYRMMLIYEKSMASKLEAGMDKSFVAVVTLDKKKVTKIDLVSAPVELGKYLK